MDDLIFVRKKPKYDWKVTVTGDEVRVYRNRAVFGFVRPHDGGWRSASLETPSKKVFATIEEAIEHRFGVYAVRAYQEAKNDR